MRLPGQVVQNHLGSGAVHRPGVMLQVHDVQLAVAEHRDRTRAQFQTELIRSPRPIAYMVAMAMSLSDRLSLAGLGTTGSSISNLDILVMAPFWGGQV